MQHIDGVDAQLLNVVTTFHDEKRGPLQFGDQFAGGQKIIGLQLEEADRILLEGAHSEGDHNRFGSELVKLFQPFLECVAPRFEPRSGKHGAVEGGAFSSALSGFLQISGEVGEGLAGVAIQREVQHILAFAEDILSAVAVVKVNVADGDASRPVIPEPLRGNGGVVQKTVASVHVRGRMVSGRPEREHGLLIALLEQFGPVNATSLLATEASQVPELMEVSEDSE